jgi:hypothetical protein
MSCTTPILSTTLAALFLGASVPALARDELAVDASTPVAALRAKSTAAPVLTESSEDPLAASFARMLRHAPSGHVPPLPVATSPDPLIEAVVLPLVQSNREQLADGPGRPCSS